MKTDLEKFKEACNYPSQLAPENVEKHLREYLTALGIERKVERIHADWHENIPAALKKNVNQILDDFAKRINHPIAAIAASDARAASDAIAASDASDASAASDDRRFTVWCVLRGGWWYSWDLSWISTTYFGAVQNKSENVKKWTKPLFKAFCAGAWLLYWTEDTLFWVSKPTLAFDDQKRLHHDSYAAVKNDVENLYFLNGVMVPAFVVVRPDWITVSHIEKEENSEVRRKMIERYGQAKYLLDAGAKEIHRDDFGTLYRKEIPGDEPLLMVKVINSTPESDGSFKDYFLRVPPTIERAKQAVAWTFNKSEAEYEPEYQT